MSVKVYDLKDNALQGMTNGYEYRFMQAVNGSSIYNITDPSGQSKMIELTSRDDVDALIKDPEAFWKLYCTK